MGLAKYSGGSGSGGLGNIAVGQEFYAEMLAVADQLITDYGMMAALRNNETGALRACTVVVSDYMPRDAQTQLANPTERTILFAAGLDSIPGLAPDWQNEQLVTYVQPPANPPVINEILSFTQPLKLYSPGGIIVLYQTNVKL
jgi:hypothetical protein